MNISKVLEALNEALASKDLTIWCLKDDVKNLKAENEKLQAKVREFESGKDEQQI